MTDKHAYTPFPAGEAVCAICGETEGQHPDADVIAEMARFGASFCRECHFREPTHTDKCSLRPAKEGW